MKAWRLQQPGHLLQLEEIPTPKPGQGEVLVKVDAAGVTPTELGWYPTTHEKSGNARTHAVPGHEFSGSISATGDRVSGVSIGEEIFGMNDWFADGAAAEYCITRPQSIAPRPAKLTAIEAASVPIGALTAWQGLFNRAKLQLGEQVLIHGGSGAVGVYAIQLAVWRGAKVVTTASSRNREFLLGLGASQVIDYRTEHFEAMLDGIDVVFDAVGGETLEKSWRLLGSSGRMVTIASDSEGKMDDRTKAAFFIVEPNRTQLVKMGDMLASGVIQAVVDAVVPFAKTNAAYAGAISNRLGRGKVVVSMNN